MEVDGGGEGPLPDLICMFSCPRYQGDPYTYIRMPPKMCIVLETHLQISTTPKPDQQRERKRNERHQKGSQAKGRPYPDIDIILPPLKVPRRTTYGDRCK